MIVKSLFPIFVTVLLWLNLAHREDEVRLERYPYLQNATGDSITIMWNTNSGSRCKVEVRMAGDSAWHEVVGKVKPVHRVIRNEVVVRNLKNDTAYYYRVYTDERNLLPADTLKFFSHRSPGNMFSFFAAGDIGEPVEEGGTPDRMAASISRRTSEFDFGLLLGDIIYQDGQSEAYDKNLFQYFARPFAAIPTFAVLGNHDWHVNPDENFLVEWKLPGNGHYYSFDYGNAHFIGLDTKDGDFYNYDEQVDWLKRDLEENADKHRWIIVFLHHNGKSCTYKSDNERVISLYPIFEKFNVDLVLNGHAHTYERLNPMNGSGTPIPKYFGTNVYRNPEGFISITTGSGGKLRGVGSDPTAYTPDPENCRHPNLVAAAKHVWAYLKITIDHSGLKGISIDSETNEPFDSFTIQKDIPK